MAKIDPHFEKILFDHKQIVAACKKAAKWIDTKYKGKRPLLVSILKGSIPFTAELIKHITTDVELDFIVYSSYLGGIASSNKKIKIVTHIKVDAKGRDVILLDDVIDTGWTIHNLKKSLLEIKKAKSVCAMCLVDKPQKREVDIGEYYSCFTIGNEFLIGFGLDYHELLRNIPYVGVLKNELFQKEMKLAETKAEKKIKINKKK